MSKWINVKEKLPENAKHPGTFCPRYQVNTKYGVTTGWYNSRKQCWYVLFWFLTGRLDKMDIDMEGGDIPRVLECPDDRNVVTHWMPLPEQPKEEK